MRKKGRFSLFVAVLLLILGLGASGLGVLGYLDVLPDAYDPLLESMSFYLSITAGANGVLEFGALVLSCSLIVFAFRQRKPYSMFLPFFLIAIYETVMILYRVSGSVACPSYLALFSSTSKIKLIAALLLLELVFTILMLVITSSMDSRWRKRRDIHLRRLESEGIILSKEERLALKEKKRIEKDLAAKKRRDDKEMARFEKARGKREAADKKRILKSQEKEERRYERVREKEERAMESTRKKSSKKAQKALDREEEKSKEKARKLEKISKREAKKREKERARVLERERMDFSEQIEVFKGSVNPNDPLSFPDFVDIPELKTFKDVEVPERREDIASYESSSILDALKDEDLQPEPIPMPVYEDITAKKKFKSGGMLEATLEMMNSPQLEVERPTAPIKGYDDVPEIEETVDVKSSFAPSGLSPEHPRYKLFEALQEKAPQPKVEREEAPKRKSDFAPSSLSPDHPRYKLFESLQNKSSGNVSHYPTRAFEPEISSTVEPQMSSYRREVPQEHRESAHSQAAFNSTYPKEGYGYQMPSPQREEIKPRAQEMPESESWVQPRSEKRIASARDYDAPSYEDIPQQTESLDMTAGIGGLVSNNLGYAAIMKRERAMYTAPPLSLLKDYPESSGEIDELTRIQGEIIVKTYAEQRIQVELDNIIKGPTVTRYELKIAAGVLISKISAREGEINYALGGKSVRILAPIPGKQAVGIEVPNDKTTIVGFKDMIYSIRNNERMMALRVPMVLGKTITGEPVVVDVAKMPHMIIAGTTGSGKSVCINAFINTLIYQKGPKDVRLILVDPKVVELTMYNGIPHLLTPVVTEAKKVVKVLNFLVEEMERRYKMLSNYGVRNIDGYNQKIKEKHIAAEKMPYIVLIMDEFADMMAVVKNDIETQIARLAAKARAAGIHMILATQRPSSDVITGTIKSNLPARVAFAVSSAINSRVILDDAGAENLLGKGDMLLMDPSLNGLQRIQGAFLSDSEVEAISDFARQVGGEPDYLDDVIFEDFDENRDDFDDDVSELLDDDSDEALYEKAKEIVYERKSCSASYLQRRMKIGYNRAARIVEMMEERGIVGPAQGSKPREILKYE